MFMINNAYAKRFPTQTNLLEIKSPLVKLALPAAFPPVTWKSLNAA
jgi:hypothetical protein